MQEWLSDVFPGAAHKRRAKSFQPQGTHGGDRQALAQAQPEPEGQVQEAGGGAATRVQSRAGCLGEGTRKVLLYIFHTFQAEVTFNSQPSSAVIICSLLLSFSVSLSSGASRLQRVLYYSECLSSAISLLLFFLHLPYCANLL